MTEYKTYAEVKAEEERQARLEAREHAAAVAARKRKKAARKRQRQARKKNR